MSSPSGASNPFSIRLAQADDLQGLLSLAKLTGPGFTSLPDSRDKIVGILDCSAKAAQGEPGTIMLVMTDDQSDGAIAGCAAVKRGGKKRAGFANFRVINTSDDGHDRLKITEEYSDITEIGSLFVHPNYRGKGVGKALAQSRYLYLATAPHSFGETVFAELRGVIYQNGVSPFFDSACKPSLQMSFAEADFLCANGANDQLLALMPKEPISTENFCPSALEAIGGCHKTGYAARAMLEREGFCFGGVVDLLDGGALVVANTASLTSVRESLLIPIITRGGVAKAEPLLFATIQPTSFRCTAGIGSVIDGAVACSEEICSALKVSEGEMIRVSKLASGDTHRH